MLRAVAFEIEWESLELDGADYWSARMADVEDEAGILTDLSEKLGKTIMLSARYADAEDAWWWRDSPKPRCGKGERRYRRRKAGERGSAFALIELVHLCHRMSTTTVASAPVCRRLAPAAMATCSLDAQVQLSPRFRAIISSKFISASPAEQDA